MSDLDADFQAAVTAVIGLPADPGNDIKLRLYGLYKQAKLGDADGNRPRFSNPVGRAKYDAWAANSGISATDAKSAYVALVHELTGTAG
jgi:diazepam-binding inhibitor (GABA receptor modulator, acyl-CoA-binding protein)